jgi:two-component system sensor histidine kinase MtrB
LLDVWSEPGQGSCFRLTLPRRSGDRVMGSPLPMPPDEPLGDDEWSEEQLKEEQA